MVRVLRCSPSVGDSVVELMSAFVVLSDLRKLNKGIFEREAESERTEKLAITLLILLIPIIAGGIVYSYLSGIKPEFRTWNRGVFRQPYIIMPILWIQKRQIGGEGKILTLRIDAAESATCFFMAVTVLGGLLLDYFLGISWADYVATVYHFGFVALEIRESLEEMGQ